MFETWDQHGRLSVQFIFLSVVLGVLSAMSCLFGFIGISLFAVGECVILFGVYSCIKRRRSFLFLYMCFSLVWVVLECLLLVTVYVMVLTDLKDIDRDTPNALLTVELTKLSFVILGMLFLAMQFLRLMTAFYAHKIRSHLDRPVRIGLLGLFSLILFIFPVFLYLYVSLSLA